METKMVFQVFLSVLVVESMRVQNAHMVARPSIKSCQLVTNVKAEPHGYAQGCSWNLPHPAIYFHSIIARLLSFNQYV
jgi:hypothetical protein